MRKSSSAFAATGSSINFDEDDEDAEEGDVLVKDDREGNDSDDDHDDAGNEEEVAPGEKFGVLRRAAKVPTKAQDEDEDDDDTGARGARRLARVRGEQRGRDAPEFNETGDAFEPFHLRNEREEGHFDETGDFVWKKKSADDQDAWLESLDSMDPRERARMQSQAAGLAGTGAGAAGVGFTRGARDSEDEDDEDRASDGPAPEMTSTERVHALVAVRDALLNEETVTGALRRLSGPSGTKAGTTGRGISSRSSPAIAGHQRDMAAFNKLTDAADRLLSGGTPEVYGWRTKDVTWALEDACDQAGIDPRTLLRGASAAAVPAAAAAAAASAPAAAAAEATGADTALWEYKWALAADTPVFGPFSASALRAWAAAGFFSAQRPIFVRSVGAPVVPASLSAATAASGAASVPPAGSAAAASDAIADDDIFAEVGKYDVAAASALASQLPVVAPSVREWLRFDAAGF